MCLVLPVVLSRRCRCRCRCGWCVVAGGGREGSPEAELHPGLPVREAHTPVLLPLLQGGTLAGAFPPSHSLVMVVRVAYPSSVLRTCQGRLNNVCFVSRAWCFVFPPLHFLCFPSSFLVFAPSVLVAGILVCGCAGLLAHPLGSFLPLPCQW